MGEKIKSAVRISILAMTKGRVEARFQHQHNPNGPSIIKVDFIIYYHETYPNHLRSIQATTDASRSTKTESITSTAWVN